MVHHQLWYIFCCWGHHQLIQRRSLDSSVVDLEHRRCAGPKSTCKVAGIKFWAGPPICTNRAMVDTQSFGNKTTGLKFACIVLKCMSPLAITVLL